MIPLARLALLALPVVLAACGQSPASVRVSSSDAAPVAAVGPAAPFDGPELLLVAVGPFTEDTEVTEIEIAGAPGWGCSAPHALRAGVWTTPGPDLAASLSLLPVLSNRDLGGGFAARRVALLAPVLVEAGGIVLVGVALDSSDACGAKTGAQSGRSWRWREGVWTQVDGTLVATAIGHVT